MKILLALLILFLNCSIAFAKSVKVESLSVVNCEHENMEFQATILKDVKFRSGLEFAKGEILSSHIKKLVPARWGKRSAYMVIEPISIGENTLDDYNLEGKTTTIKVIDKDNVKEELKNTAKQAGINTTKKITNTLLPGSEQIFDISRGIIAPAEGKTRLQSAAGNLIDDLPTKHLKKGAELDIKEGDKIVLKIYRTDVSRIRFFKRNK